MFLNVKYYGLVLENFFLNLVLMILFGNEYLFYFIFLKK